METDDCICIEEEEDEAGDSLPPANECMKLCETFAEFTETDKALAMMYLQQTSWNLELALASFYDGTGDQAPTTTKSGQRRRIESSRTQLVRLTTKNVPKPPPSSCLNGLRYPGDIVTASADCLV
ncbi:unnamed protein product [Schistocephalus solidus]|uniref:CUE domain-containing protein n=1 Tax=Schistocephalus solidus TaxID=70667 RepID=A0A183TRW9_SCHSO|nr:unnamed protein product [Schistocephalus solidus]